MLRPCRHTSVLFQLNPPAGGGRALIEQAAVLSDGSSATAVAPATCSPARDEPCGEYRQAPLLLPAKTLITIDQGIRHPSHLTRCIWLCIHGVSALRIACFQADADIQRHVPAAALPSNPAWACQMVSSHRQMTFNMPTGKVPQCSNRIRRAATQNLRRNTPGQEI